MALLTDATVIIEAGEKSGAVPQGWEALRLGRLLFPLESVAKRQFSFGAGRPRRDRSLKALWDRAVA